VNTATVISRLQKKFRKKSSRESRQSTVGRDGHLRWQGKIWRVMRLRARRQKAKGKNSLSERQVSEMANDLFHSGLLPFAFCLLPSCAARCAS